MNCTELLLLCVASASISACVPRATDDPADVEDTARQHTDSPVPEDTDETTDSDASPPLPTGERIEHADGGVYDTTGAYQLILKDAFVCYLIQELSVGTRFNIIAVGLEQALVHMVAENYVWSESPTDGYEVYARIDLHSDGERFLVGGHGGAQIVNLISGHTEALRTEQTDHAAWIGDGMLLGYNLYETVADARNDEGRPIGEVGDITAGYLGELYGSDGTDVYRESLNGERDRISHRVPRSLFRDWWDYDQFDVVEQVVVMWIRLRQGYVPELIWADGSQQEILGSFRPPVDGDSITGVACTPGDAR